MAANNKTALSTTNRVVQIAGEASIANYSTGFSAVISGGILEFASGGDEWYYVRLCERRGVDGAVIHRSS
jgi:hypothetical protein